MSVKKAAECIKSHKNFLISTHTNPEGDALGSELAVFDLLDKLGKSAVIVNEDNIPPEFNFLPGKKNIKKLKNNFDKTQFDCFIVLDCSDLKRTGEVYKINLKANKTILNIDHHISNQLFGDINWVEPHSSSCSEMIFKLYKELRQAIDDDAALCMYMGIFTDTGSFRYSNTTAFTHKIVSELLKHGNIDISLLYRNIYENIPFEDIKLLVKTLPTLRRAADGKVAWFQIDSDKLRGKRAGFDLTDGLLSFARSIKDVEVAVLFKENFGSRDQIGVNLRSQGRIDVNKIASFFGGGGHKTASGCTVKGDIERVRKLVLDKIIKILQ